MFPKAQEPITLYCDNSGAVANSKEPRSHKRGKHIEQRYHMLREIVHRWDIIGKKIWIYYYMFALVFVVFDGEIAFLFPWAMSFDILGVSIFIEYLS